MKRIGDTEKIRQWIEESGIRQYFDTPDLKFEAYSYEKGELIASPQMKLDRLLFLVEGVVLVYGILPDGRLLPVDHAEKYAMFGDIEYTSDGESSFYCEAATDLICLSLKVSMYRDKLDHDLAFLHTLLCSYRDKIILSTHLDVCTASLEERVLAFMRNISPNGELSGMEASAMKLRCSRRQLQRVVDKLCREGTLRKTGRGTYRLL